jgi:hypothetical protein
MGSKGARQFYDAPAPQYYYDPVPVGGHAAALVSNPLAVGVLSTCGQGSHPRTGELLGGTDYQFCPIETVGVVGVEKWCFSTPSSTTTHRGRATHERGLPHFNDAHVRVANPHNENC